MLISVYSHNQCEHITDLHYNVTKQFSFDSQLVDVSLVCLRFLVLWSRTATPKKTWIEKGINIFSNNFTNTQLGPLTRKSNSNSGIDSNNSSSDKSLLGFFLLVDTDSISSTAFNSSSSQPQRALQEKVADRPPRNPPTNIFGQVERRIAEKRNQLRNRNQDQNIPFAQDEEFISTMWELLPMCVYFSRTVENGTFKLRTFVWEQQRYFSVYLASIKRDYLLSL